jgi:predicted RNase H-like HicB family nuclease
MYYDMLQCLSFKAITVCRSPYHEEGSPVKLKVVVHKAEEGGYWAEVPAIPGCATQGETFEELLASIYEAVDACLSVDAEHVEVSDEDKVMEIAV